MVEKMTSLEEKVREQDAFWSRELEQAEENAKEIRLTAEDIMKFCEAS